MAKIGQSPQAPMWPWGGPRSVRERLVDKAQVSTKARKKGDPKNPSLASAALLDFIGPAHSAESLRLPMPPSPPGHDGGTAGFADGPRLAVVAGRNDEGQQAALQQSVAGLRAPPERLERLKALLDREAEMLGLVQQVAEDMAEVERLRRDEQAGEGY
ncbi:MAG: hypothetical protein JNG84_02610 [Archangium sp.]|nr:hypothetical protein [Archangium sp.]